MKRTLVTLLLLALVSSGAQNLLNEGSLKGKLPRGIEMTLGKGGPDDALPDCASGESEESESDDAGSYGRVYPGGRGVVECASGFAVYRQGREAGRSVAEDVCLYGDAWLGILRAGVCDSGGCRVH